MKKSLLLLVLIEGVCFLNACGGSSGSPPPLHVATHFAVTAPAAADTGSVFSFTVTALDDINNVASGYSGTVRFTSTDGKAVLPGNTALAGGMGMFSATLETVGPQTITVTDMVKTMIGGTSSSITISLAVLTITSGPPPPGTVGVMYGTSQGCLWRLSHTVFTLTANKGKPPYSWSGSSQAPGLTVTYQSFAGVPPLCQGYTIPVIEGTPTAAGSYNVTVTVTDSGSPPVQASASYTIMINAAPAAANASADLASTSEPSSEKAPAKHHMYKLIDIGTFGGPNSYIEGINSGGAVVGIAETPTTDPFLPNCLGGFYTCLVNHAIEWRNGISTDLGTLPGVNDSFAFWINDLGGIAGVSENGLIDPLTGFPEVIGVYWKDGKIIDLGTFGGNASYANAINNAGQIVGMASNTIPDNYSTGIGLPYFNSAFPVATQFRAFLWQHGVMQDLGTLGGNSAQAVFVNDRGQVIGVSYTNTVADPSTTFPTQDPFFWENGKMTDIGSLGGARGCPVWINNRGQVVGVSDLGGYNAAGQPIQHGFFWDKKDGFKDIGSLGGTQSYLNSVNDNGEAVGASSLAGDQLNHALLWKNGNVTDLGVPPGMESSEALRINAKGQIVGGTGNGFGSVGPYTGWLWENGGPIVDLNQLIVPGSDITVAEAQWINDRGEITCTGVTPNGDLRGVILIPDGDCDDACEARIAESQNNPSPTQVNSATKIGTPAIHGRFARRFQLPTPGPNN